MAEVLLFNLQKKFADICAVANAFSAKD
jgi:hypothetical protein